LLGALQVNVPNPSIANAGTTETHALLPGSPAIDRVTAGGCPPPGTDQRRVLRPQGALCDIGAFELQVGSTPCILGDINCDGIVDIRDYGLWRQGFGVMDCANPADITVDCLVDIRDYGIWRANFGHTAGAAARTATPVPTPTPGRALARGDDGSVWGVIRRAAQALGITFPNEIMLQVTEVIQ
jgi:hypothetical protein